ncbi:MAG: hypothetical protein PVSMB4_07010 [Ktedonobacterales bacterium]
MVAMSLAALGALVLAQVIHLEAWIGLAGVAFVFSLFIVVPLGVMIAQSPRLLRDRHYGLFALVSFIASFTIFTGLAMTVPLLLAIWVPYPNK